ncbi:thioredoxin-like protein [Aspergillus similis]
MSSLGLTNQASTVLRALRPRCLRPSSVSVSSTKSLTTTRASTLASTFSRPRISAPKNYNSFAKRAFSSSSTVLFHPSAAKMGASEHVPAITSKAEFQEKVLNAKGLVVVDCFATWCGPCKAIAPAVEKFAQTYTDASFYQIDVDELSEVAAELGIRAMPTFLLFKDGEKVNEVVGANPGALEAGVKALVA